MNCPGARLAQRVVPVSAGNRSKGTSAAQDAEYVVAARMVHLSQREAEGFYAVHRERPFFADLVKYMTSGPVMVQVLEGENAILKNREIMGATDPKKAAPGTIRADLAQSMEANPVPGSDGPETAAQEIAYFFRPTELCPRG